jgi:hypothetical protein
MMSVEPIIKIEGMDCLSEDGPATLGLVIVGRGVQVYIPVAISQGGRAGYHSVEGSGRGWRGGMVMSAVSQIEAMGYTVRFEHYRPEYFVQRCPVCGYESPLICHRYYRG